MDEIIRLIQSDDFKERAKGEYLFVKDKHTRLQKLIVRREAGKLDFEPKCPITNWKLQELAMDLYLHQLETKALLEDIDLD